MGWLQFQKDKEKEAVQPPPGDPATPTDQDGIKKQQGEDETHMEDEMSKLDEILSLLKELVQQKKEPAKPADEPKKEPASTNMPEPVAMQFQASLDKIVQMHINNETTYGMGIAAAAMGRKHPSGAWTCDTLLANVNKVHVATLPYETSRLAQDIAGGIGETGCMPSFKDFNSEKYGELIKKYMKAASPAEARTRAARLVEWTTIGAGVPGCMHGGGSPDGAKLFIRATGDLERKVEIARRLAGISDEIPDPAPKKK